MNGEDGNGLKLEKIAIFFKFSNTNSTSKIRTLRSAPLSLWMKPLNVAFPVKATEQHFLVMLFIVLYKVALTLKSVNEILIVIIQIEATD